jgi:hypothetical protein
MYSCLSQVENFQGCYSGVITSVVWHFIMDLLRPHFLVKDMEQIVVLLGNILNAIPWVPLGCMPHLIAWVEQNFIFNFFYHHFWPNFFKELCYLMWFILINLISCDASQSIYYYYYYFARALWLAHHQRQFRNFSTSPTPSSP